MPSTLGKNLHMCFTSIVCDSPSAAPHNNPDHDHHRRPSMFIKNFNSLYDDYDSSSNSKPLARTHSFEPDTDPDSDSEPDFATVVASQRFFFTSPGRSNSIVESTPSVATTPETSHQSDSNQSSKNSFFSCVIDSVAVSTDSPDPYMDFRRSMQEMVEARGLIDAKANWDYLHELLLCYLALNPKTTHKFIVSAFADLLGSLMSPPEKNDGAGGCRISE